MPKRSLIITALMLQVAAQALGGVWGAAIGGVIIGLALRRRGAFRTGFLAASVAAALLLGMIAIRGGDVTALASMLGANFKAPGWVLLVATCVLPGLQAGGLAGGVSRLAQRSAD